MTYCELVAVPVTGGSFIPFGPDADATVAVDRPKGMDSTILTVFTKTPRADDADDAVYEALSVALTPENVARLIRALTNAQTRTGGM